jgi:hypothetical protein
MWERALLGSPAPPSVMIGSVLARAGKCPEVVLEVTYRWYWGVDALPAGGVRMHLAHLLGVKAFAYRPMVVTCSRR